MQRLLVALLLVVPLALRVHLRLPDGPELIHEDALDDGMVCNGWSQLCTRTYDNVTFPETHNAFATHEDGIFTLQATIVPALMHSGTQA